MTNEMNGRGTETLPAKQIEARRIEVADDGEFANLMDTGRSAQLWRMAQTFAASQLVPLHFQNSPANCFIALQMSMRMKVDPFMFMQNTYIVYGRPGMEAKLAIALINSSGLFTDSLDYEIIGKDARANGYQVRAFANRKSTGKRVEGPWIDWDLVRAEEWDKKKGSKWMTMPAMMFQYRAATFFGRLHCPERLMGMQTVDELRDTGELPADRNIPAATSRTASLSSKLGITQRSVSEQQAFEPADNADASIAAQDAHAGEVIDATGEVVAPNAPTPETGESAPATTSTPTLPAATFLSHAKWRDAMDSAASQMQLPEEAYQAAMGKACGAKPELLMPTRRKELWAELNKQDGAFA